MSISDIQSYKSATKFLSFHLMSYVRIDVDHDKLDDINLRAQNAWKPVEVHEVDVDPVTLFAALFGTLAIVLFTVH